MYSLRLIAPMVSALALAACAVGPNYVAPITPPTAAGQFVSANSPALSNDPAASNWWANVSVLLWWLALGVASSRMPKLVPLMSHK